MLRRIKLVTSVTVLMVLVLLSTSVIQAAITDPDDVETIASVILSPANSEWSYLDTGENASYVINGITMVPIGDLSEALGWDVNPLENTHEVTIRNEINKIELVIDSLSMIIKDTQNKTSKTLAIRNGEVFVPLRYVAEYFGYHVYWQVNTSDTDKRIFVWVSELALLEESDVFPDENYTVIGDINFSYCLLNDDGATSRGVQLGDTYEKIIEQYGIPHGKEFNGQHDILYYSTIRRPYRIEGTTLAFYLYDGIAEEIYIFYGT